MDSHQVRQLEEQVARAITVVLKEHLPGHRESPRTTHLMAKAAVAVLEAVVEKPAANSPGSSGS
jgi:hypothetical protein